MSRAHRQKGVACELTEGNAAHRRLSRAHQRRRQARQIRERRQHVHQLRDHGAPLHPGRVALLLLGPDVRGRRGYPAVADGGLGGRPLAHVQLERRERQAAAGRGRVRDHLLRSYGGGRATCECSQFPWRAHPLPTTGAMF